MTPCESRSAAGADRAGCVFADGMASRRAVRRRPAGCPKARRHPPSHVERRDRVPLQQGTRSRIGMKRTTELDLNNPNQKSLLAV